MEIFNNNDKVIIDDISYIKKKILTLDDVYLFCLENGKKINL